MIIDSDWNPHNNMLAGRSHRIGHQNQYSYIALSHALLVEVLQQRKKCFWSIWLCAQAISQDEMDDVLKFGAHELFEDDLTTMTTAAVTSKFE